MLQVEKSQLSVKDGVVSGGGKTISYGELVRGQQLKLTIPVTGDLTSMFGLTVTGNPPMKPVERVHHHRQVIPEHGDAVQGQRQGSLGHRRAAAEHAARAGRASQDARLDADLRRRSEQGAISRTRRSSSKAISLAWSRRRSGKRLARRSRSRPTRSGPSGRACPGHTQLHTWLREQADWKTTPVSKSEKSRGDVAPALASASKTLSASYELPFMKHAPIGPTIAVGDARPDGTVYVHTHNQNPQALRGQIAMMLGTSVDNVVVRIYAGPGHYGRSNGGNAGAEDEAVILSKAVGRPVRVQWMRPDDLHVVHAVSARALRHPDRMGREREDHRLSGRPLHARDAGRPSGRGAHRRAADAAAAGCQAGAPGRSVRPLTRISDPWVYDRVPNVAESGYGTFQLGQKASPLAIGLRDHSMRTPGQLQQNYPRELAISEAAALAGIDAIEFRLKQTDDQRLIGVLKAVREASGWQTRPSPSPKAGADRRRGRVTGRASR